MLASTDGMDDFKFVTIAELMVFVLAARNDLTIQFNCYTAFGHIQMAE